MAFCLTNAPATFQCLMELCLGDMHLKWCIIYLDGITIFLKTPEEHIQRLRGVFEKLSAAMVCDLNLANVNILKPQNNSFRAYCFQGRNRDRSKEDNCYQRVAQFLKQ